ncbi:MAG: hypothetical protein M0Z45_09950 [Actinomycetota bacterium]|nr:hypothetical protein [Actinomycetota bacterium]
MPNDRLSIDTAFATDKRLILIPVRSFEVGKSRLGEISATNRRRLLANLAEGVITGLEEIARRVVVTTTDEVAKWGQNLGCLTIVTSSPLNQALREALEEFGASGGYGVVMGDIALASRPSLAQAVSSRTPLVTCDRLRAGTSIVTIPSEKVIDFKFGEDSFKSHIKEIMRHFSFTKVSQANKNTIDIDSIEDLLALQKDSNLSQAERKRIETMIELTTNGAKIDL